MHWLLDWTRSEFLAHPVELFDAINIIVENALWVAVGPHLVIQNRDIFHNHLTKPSVEQLGAGWLPEIRGTHPRVRDHGKARIHPVTKSILPSLLSNIHVALSKPNDNCIRILGQLWVRSFDQFDYILRDQLMAVTIKRCR